MNQLFYPVNYNIVVTFSSTKSLGGLAQICFVSLLFTITSLWPDVMLIAKLYFHITRCSRVLRGRVAPQLNKVSKLSARAVVRAKLYS